MFRKASFNSIFSTLDVWYRYRIFFWQDIFCTFNTGTKNRTRKQFYSVFPFCELMHTFVFSRANIKIAAQKEHHPKLMGPSRFCWAHPISAFLSHSFSHKKCMSLLHQITFRLLHLNNDCENYGKKPRKWLFFNWMDFFCIVFKAILFPLQHFIFAPLFFHSLTVWLKLYFRLPGRSQGSHFLHQQKHSHPTRIATITS